MFNVPRPLIREIVREPRLFDKWMYSKGNLKFIDSVK